MGAWEGGSTGRGVCVCRADSLRWTAETNVTLQQLYSGKKKEQGLEQRLGGGEAGSHAQSWASTFQEGKADSQGSNQEVFLEGLAARSQAGWSRVNVLGEFSEN